MPDVRQTILTPDPPGIKPKGNRNDDNIKASFPGSPLPDYEGEVYTDLERKQFYQSEVLTGLRSGHGISNFNLDYRGTPDDINPNIPGITTVMGPNGTPIPVGGGGGAPTTPYIPPLTSPGEGSGSATDQPAYTGTTQDPESNTEFGSGLGGLTSTRETSSQIAGQSVLIDYISGRSYGGSGG